MPEGSLLLEFCQYRRFKPCYLSLTSSVGVRYACVTDAPDLEQEEEWPDHRPDTDFTVPIARVQKAIKILGL
jgi:hypothetical protein